MQNQMYTTPHPYVECSVRGWCPGFVLDIDLFSNMKLLKWKEIWTKSQDC